MPRQRLEIAQGHPTTTSQFSLYLFFQFDYPFFYIIFISHPFPFFYIILISRPFIPVPALIHFLLQLSLIWAIKGCALLEKEVLISPQEFLPILASSQSILTLRQWTFNVCTFRAALYCRRCFFFFLMWFDRFDAPATKIPQYLLALPLYKVIKNSLKQKSSSLFLF